MYHTYKTPKRLQRSAPSKRLEWLTAIIGTITLYVWLWCYFTLGNV